MVASFAGSKISRPRVSNATANKALLRNATSAVLDRTVGKKSGLGKTVTDAYKAAAAPDDQIEGASEARAANAALKKTKSHQAPQHDAAASGNQAHLPERHADQDGTDSSLIGREGDAGIQSKKALGRKGGSSDIGKKHEAGSSLQGISKGALSPEEAVQKRLS